MHQLDYLDSMAWSIVMSAVLLAVVALRLRYKASSDSVEEEGRNLRMGLASTIGLSGFYLFITGITISFSWPYADLAGGAYNVLFGGSAAIGGLVLLATSAALFLNGGLKAVSYFAAVFGIYIFIDAAAILNYRLTKTPELAALGYLSIAATAFLSVPATHSDNKWLRRLFAVLAILFALIWLFESANFTWGHLQPPPPAPA